jgi:hypothetical protein
VSGKLGEGEAGEPYDAGNEDGMCDAHRADERFADVSYSGGSVKKTS